MNTDPPVFDPGLMQALIDAVVALEKRLAQPPAPPQVASPWLTTAEAAAYLKLGNASSIRSLIWRRDLRPDGQVGRTFVFRAETLDAYAVSNLPERLGSAAPEAHPPRAQQRRSLPTRTPPANPFVPPPGYKPDEDRLRRSCGLPPRPKR